MINYFPYPFTICKWRHKCSKETSSFMICWTNFLFSLCCWTLWNIFEFVKLFLFCHDKIEQLSWYDSFNINLFGIPNMTSIEMKIFQNLDLILKGISDLWFLNPKSYLVFKEKCLFVGIFHDIDISWEVLFVCE